MTGQHVRIIINPRLGVYSWLYRPFRLLPFLAISASQEGKNQRQSGQWWGRIGDWQESQLVSRLGDGPAAGG